LQALGQRPSNRYEKKKESGDDAVHILLQMVMADPNGILLRENRKAAGGSWLMALIRHIEEACDVSRKLAMSTWKAKRTNYGKSVSHTKLAVVASAA
jgi:hypothetical protein